MEMPKCSPCDSLCTSQEFSQRILTSLFGSEKKKKVSLPLIAEENYSKYRSTVKIYQEVSL